MRKTFTLPSLYTENRSYFTDNSRYLRHTRVLGAIVKAVTIFFLALFSVGVYALPNLEPQSPEAWRYAVTRGSHHIPLIYERTDEGLVCKQIREGDTRNILEGLAAEHNVHPAQIAEELSVYLWNDWSVFYVSGYDMASFIATSQSAADFGAFLDAFYLEHHACLLAAMRVLVAGYEGRYAQDEQGLYHYNHATEAESYHLYALEPKNFPGTGIFEPLGIVYMSRYADLLSVSWIRRQVVNRFAGIIEKRSMSGNPLKVTE